MNNDITPKLCKYVYKTFRPKYKSNLEFANVCDIDEKTVRLIQQEKYNMSLKVFKKICDSQNVKMSEVLISINE